MTERFYESITIHSEGIKEVGWDFVLQSISVFIGKINIPAPIPIHREEYHDGFESLYK
jgi:hypothetical protein